MRIVYLGFAVFLCLHFSCKSYYSGYSPKDMDDHSKGVVWALVNDTWTQDSIDYYHEKFESVGVVFAVEEPQFTDQGYLSYGRFVLDSDRYFGSYSNFDGNSLQDGKHCVLARRDFRKDTKSKLILGAWNCLARDNMRSLKLRI